MPTTMPTQKVTGLENDPEKPKNRSHTFLGEDVAAPVLAWYGRKDRPKNDPVTKLIQLEQRREFEDVRGEIVALVNKTVRRWKLVLTWVAHTELDEPTEWNADLRPDWRKAVAAPEQVLAFVGCLNLKRLGLLHRIRRCACGATFFARFDHQFAHNDQCRLQALGADEARKVARAAYMRQLRRARKQLLMKKGETR